MINWNNILEIESDTLFMKNSYIKTQHAKKYIEQENELYILFKECLITGQPMKEYSKPLLFNTPFAKADQYDFLFDNTAAENAYEKVIKDISNKFNFQDCLFLCASAGRDKGSILSSLPSELAYSILSFKLKLNYPSYMMIAKKFNFPATYSMKKMDEYANIFLERLKSREKKLESQFKIEDQKTEKADDDSICLIS